MSVYADAGSLDAKGPAVSNDGKVIFGRADDVVMLWSQEDGSVRQLASSTLDSTGCCDISADGSTAIYATKSPNYNIEKISTTPGASSTVINLGGTSERASDPAISADGAFAAYVSNWPSSEKHEVWLHHGGNGAPTSERITDTINIATKCWTSSWRSANIVPLLQSYWPTSSPYDTTLADSFTPSSQSCSFLTRAGILPGKSTIEPLFPSISGDGRYVTFVSDFPVDDIVRTNSKHKVGGSSNPPLHTVHLYDRKLGITSLISDTYPDRVSGQAACCPTSSSSYQIGSCSLSNHLQGRCCDQTTCRMNLNAEISGDGTKIVWVGDVSADGSQALPKGDLEVFVHDVPTDTTHRLTYTNDASLDSTFPHINHDGTVVTWEEKAGYGEPAGAPTTNKDVWMTRIAYGCDDPSASNYDAHADINVCCTYADATLGSSAGDAGMAFQFALNLTSALERTVGIDASLSCLAWHDAVASDVVCALRIPSNAVSISSNDCASLHRALETGLISVYLTAHSMSGGESAQQLVSRLQGQLRNSDSAIWKGRVTRFTQSAIRAPPSHTASTAPTSWSYLYTSDVGVDQAAYIRGTPSRLTYNNGTGTRSSSAPRVASGGGYVVFESESDIANLGVADNDYVCIRRLDHEPWPRLH